MARAFSTAVIRLCVIFVGRDKIRDSRRLHALNLAVLLVFAGGVYG